MLVSRASEPALFHDQLKRDLLIQQRVDGQRRPCRLDEDRLRELGGWIGEQQREWESRLDRLEDTLAGVREP